MSTPFKPSKACCKRAPFVLPDLPLRGQFVENNGLKIYTTGAPSARKGVMVVYDIFGLFPQTLYGADVLAHGESAADPAATSYRVFVPDFLGNKAAAHEWYPPTTPEKADALNAFFAGPADTKIMILKLRDAWTALSKEYPDIESWSLVGYCFGGEVAQYAIAGSLVEWTEEGSVAPKHPFSALVMLHSGFTDEEKVAKAIDVPVLVLNSGEETQEEMEVFLKGTAESGTEVRVEWFVDMVHGWMSARGELSDGKVMEDFLKGYGMVREFLDQHQ